MQKDNALDILMDLAETSERDKIFELVDKYLINNIEGVGCSIFLVDPTSNDLKLAYSRSIPKEKWKNATYKIGEGFTGWVFKYKKLLYIKNEKNKRLINKIKPEPPEHAGESADKPCETKQIGPFMAAPIIKKGSFLFCADDIRDIREFAEKLCHNGDPIAKYIMDNLGKETREEIEHQKDFSRETSSLRIKLIEDLNRLLQGPSIFEEKRFSGVNLSNEVRKMAHQDNLDGEDLIILNRLLLEEAYADEIARRYVIGVIRLPAVVGDKKEFTNDEQSMFITFAARIAETIENANFVNKHHNLISAYSKLGNINRSLSKYYSMGKDSLPIPNILTDVVKEIPNIVGGGYCSIFLIEDSNKIRLKATTSPYEVFLQYIDKDFYVMGSPGITSWVAGKGASVRINDINNVKEIKKFDSELICLRGPCEIHSGDVGPFLAVPILNENESIGVIRLVRHKGSKPFEEIDEELLKGFSDVLSLVISNINRKQELDRSVISKMDKYNKIFSNELIKKGRNLDCIDYADEIKCFLKFNGKGEDIPLEILNSLEYLWEKKYGMKYNFPLLREFRSYENMLLELPRYRDHFIHQFQVFLLGSIIIDELYKLSKEKGLKNYYDYFRESLHINNLARAEADAAWLITSSFHDVAYPIEKSDQLFNNFFNRFMGLREYIVDTIRLEKVLCDCNYGKLIDELCDLYVSINEELIPWNYDARDIRVININDHFNRGVRSKLINDRDHGVLGALILLHQSKAGTEEFSKIIYPSALAIALHNKLLFYLHDDIKFETNPLAFLLRYCDLVQEWGRSEEHTPETPKLECINVQYNDQDKKIHVSTRITVGDLRLADGKAKEAIKVFNRLISNDIIFEFSITENGRQFRSRTS